MITAFDGTVHVSYGQIYVTSDPVRFIDGFEDCRVGQLNGLCGAATPGLLFLTTGLHTGDVRFTVERHTAEPLVTEQWEEVVEVSFRPLTHDVALTQWAAERSWPLSLNVVDYRVRYCASGMDDGHAIDTTPRHQRAPDRYLLQFWPAPPAPDSVVRQQSGIAAYWHKVARSRPRTEGRAQPG